MSKQHINLFKALIIVLAAYSCNNNTSEERDIVSDPFIEEQQEVIEAVNTIVIDAETANLDGLRDIHLVSDKFTKFGPRNFERQGVAQTNESEVDFFGKVADYKEEVSDLKVDVFGQVAIATYYRSVSYIQDDEEKRANLRQTLVFVKTDDGWKIAHEHGTRPNE